MKGSSCVKRLRPCSFWPFLVPPRCSAVVAASDEGQLAREVVAAMLVVPRLAPRKSQCAVCGIVLQLGCS